MSKVLRMIDFDDLITYEHEQFLIEEGMKNDNGWDEEELEDENITDDDRFENYVNPDADFTADDIPF